MTREERRRIAILQIFAEAQRKGRPRGANLSLSDLRRTESRMTVVEYDNVAIADLRRTRHRAAVVEHELNLRVRLRQGVTQRPCYLCGARVEWRRGRKNLLEHRCLGGRVRAPIWPRVDLRIERMLADRVPVTTIALRLGLSRTAVYKNTRT